MNRIWPREVIAEIRLIPCRAPVASTTGVSPFLPQLRPALAVLYRPVMKLRDGQNCWLPNGEVGSRRSSWRGAYLKYAEPLAAICAATGLQKLDLEGMLRSRDHQPRRRTPDAQKVIGRGSAARAAGTPCSPPRPGVPPRSACSARPAGPAAPVPGTRARWHQR
jgi:hypothetical protein